MNARSDTALRVVLSAHFVEVAGHVYTSGENSYESWQPHLKVFSTIRPIARITNRERIPQGWVPADGPGVEFHPVSDFSGLWEFLLHPCRVFSDCRRAFQAPGPVILLPSLLSLVCRLNLRPRRHVYAVEIVGHAGVSIGMLRNLHPAILRYALGEISHRFTRWLARGAVCVSYVSNSLRSLYPSSNPSLECVVSDVMLTAKSFGRARTAADFSSQPLRIISVGRLEPEKGHVVLIDALAKLAFLGFDLQCDIVGSGRELERLQHQVSQLHLNELVKFHGQVPMGEPLWRMLADADIFVLPSLTEGLPRALIEAMAAGLPAIASNVGGILELLEPQMCVAPGDADGLANVIQRTATNRTEMARLSARNIAVAKDFNLELLQTRREHFYAAISRAWQAHSATLCLDEEVAELNI